MGAKRLARITLVVLIIGVAVVAISLRQGMLKQVWESVAYTDWTPETLIVENDKSIPVNPLAHLVTLSGRYKVKRQRWRWLPGQDVISFPILNDEYESLLEEQRNRRAKGGQ